MRFGYSPTCLSHDTGPRHPESPDRLRAIREGLSGRHGVAYHEADPAGFETMARVHEGEYLESVRAFCADGGGQWDADTVAVEATWPAIRASAGQAVWAAEAALEGAAGRETPFAIGRPPGHHAEPDQAMGFCFVNNVAVATRWALERPAVERVAILDWDVHHGNGTQAAFETDPAVCFLSLHEDGLYPATGQLTESGFGAGAGSTVNLPMPVGAGDADYCLALEEVVEPVVTAHDPDLVLVSAGFDAHRHDPISRIRLTTEGYAMLTERVVELADAVDAPLAFVLEGGYALQELADAVGIVHEVFDGYEPAAPEGSPRDETRAVLAAAVEVHGLES